MHSLPLIMSSVQGLPSSHAWVSFVADGADGGESGGDWTGVD
jgi:hypothetical protein